MNKRHTLSTLTNLNKSDWRPLRRWEKFNSLTDVQITVEIRAQNWFPSWQQMMDPDTRELGPKVTCPSSCVHHYGTGQTFYFRKKNNNVKEGK